MVPGGSVLGCGRGATCWIEFDVPLESIATLADPPDEAVGKEPLLVDVALVVVADPEDPIEGAGASSGSDHHPGRSSSVFRTRLDGEPCLSGLKDAIPHRVVQVLSREIRRAGQVPQGHDGPAGRRVRRNFSRGNGFAGLGQSGQSRHKEGDNQSTAHACEKQI